MNEAAFLKLELLEHLRAQFGGEFDLFSAEAAIWWFASDHHEGQTSPLYGVLSMSEYSPSILCNNIGGEDDSVQGMYEELCHFRGVAALEVVGLSEDGESFDWRDGVS